VIIGVFRYFIVSESILQHSSERGGLILWNYAPCHRHIVEAKLRIKIKGISEPYYTSPTMKSDDKYSGSGQW